LVSAGGSHPIVVFIAADRELFTPCGAGLDWIIELGSLERAVVIQRDPAGAPMTYSAHDLMPHYAI